MGWTKRAFVTAAFSEIGIASYDIALPADQVVSAVQRLDAMMADWNGRGIRLGYPLEGPTATDIDAESGVPDWANRAIICNLALEIAPGVGRQPMPATSRNAKMGFSTVSARCTRPLPMQLPGTMPAGQGNRWQRTTLNPFLNPPADEIAAGDDGIIEYD